MDADDDTPDYEAAYSEPGFRDKLARYASAAGREVVEKGLTLFYTLQQDNLPKWVRTTIIGALGYFILPTDAILDLTPVVGYADDLGVLAAALATAAAYVSTETRQRARQQAERWFPRPPDDAQAG